MNMKGSCRLCCSSLAYRSHTTQDIKWLLICYCWPVEQLDSVLFTCCIMRPLSTDIRKCWRCFILACRILCSKQISKGANYAWWCVMHCSFTFVEELKEYLGSSVSLPTCTCIATYSHILNLFMALGAIPLSATASGILGSMPNNNWSIEIQIASHFLTDSQTFSASHPTAFAEHF